MNAAGLSEYHLQHGIMLHDSRNEHDAASSDNVSARSVEFVPLCTMWVEGYQKVQKGY